jgi:hypothetical protein
LFLGVPLHQVHFLFAAASPAKVIERFGIDGKEAHCRAIFRSHVSDRGPVRQGHPRDAAAKELHELVDHADFAEDLRHGQDQIRRRHARFQVAGQFKPDHLRHEHVKRLA